MVYKYAITPENPNVSLGEAMPILAALVCAIAVIVLFIPWKKYILGFKLKFSREGLKPFRI